MKILNLSPDEVEELLIFALEERGHVVMDLINFKIRTEIIETGIGEYEETHFDGASVKIAG